MEADTKNGPAAEPEPMPEPTELEVAVVRLMLAQFDAWRVMILGQALGTEALVIEASDRYWEAFTRGWGKERHARVFLLQCIDEVEIQREIVQRFAALAREKLNGSTFSTPLDPVFELFSAPLFRESFEASVEQREFSAQDTIRATYSRAYPIEARRLTDEQLERAVREWGRKGGARKSKGEPHKWEFFAQLFNAIGLGPVEPGTLYRQWDEWRQNEKAHNAAVAMPGVDAGGNGKAAVTTEAQPEACAKEPA
ncbi:MAG: hypothetical protein IPM35_10265 [Myxococcales bacterium]|nr:hypothetical protein [Myxococcales bacterium]